MAFPTPSDELPTVERARPADVDAIRRLLLGSIEQQHYFDPTDLPDEASVRDEAGRTERFVVRLGGRVVGTATLHLSGGVPEVLDPSTEAAIRAPLVAPDTRGNALGEVLVQTCVKRAAAAGKRRVLALTERRSTLGQRFYERMGFVRLPERDWAPVPGVNVWVYVREL